MQHSEDHAKSFLIGESWRQWIGTLGPMILTALGVAFWVVGAINNVHDEIALARAEHARATSEVVQKVAADEARINAMDRSIAEVRASLQEIVTLMLRRDKDRKD